MMLRISVLSVLTGVAAMAAGPPTFNKDVLPILQKNCQVCHRPGEVAPMSFLTYEDVRPWAKAMKNAVLTNKMPPWFADNRYGHFSNDRQLTDAEVKALSEWADNGAPEGDAKDRPKAIAFREGWNITPDIVVEMPNEVHLPATGDVDYQYILVKTNFKEDMWASAAELRPGNRQVVHHARAYVLPPGSHYVDGATPGVPFVMKDLAARAVVTGDSQDMSREILTKWNPGLNEQTFDSYNAAKFIPKGSDIVFEIHYTTNSKPATDKSKVGIQLAKAPPKLRYFTSDSLLNLGFVIKPGDANAEVRQEVIVQDDVQLVWLQPHMHLRGKDMEIRAYYPSGESETLLKAKFDFNWQLGYEEAKPITIPKGTHLFAITHFDNSANNKFNPDPKAEVRFGFQSWEEMSVGFFSVITDAKVDPKKLFTTVPEAQMRAAN
jgi:hypothetical protein